jgi:hypothetical protein
MTCVNDPCGQVWLPVFGGQLHSPSSFLDRPTTCGDCPKTVANFCGMPAQGWNDPDLREWEPVAGPTRPTRRQS